MSRVQIYSDNNLRIYVYLLRLVPHLLKLLSPTSKQLQKAVPNVMMQA